MRKNSVSSPTKHSKFSGFGCSVELFLHTVTVDSLFHHVPSSFLRRICRGWKGEIIEDVSTIILNLREVSAISL